MKKNIVLTGQQMVDMGWCATVFEASMLFTLEVNSADRTIKMSLTNVEDGGYMPLDFDWEETLKDLDDNNLLPNGIFQGNSLFYNDHENETSCSVFHGEIAEIIGDTSTLELKLYSTLTELNADIPSDFSFSWEPCYPQNEE